MFRPEMMTSTLKRTADTPNGKTSAVEVCKKTLKDVPMRWKSRRRKSRVTVQLAIV